ncbi:IS66 family insertion sequence element accessory protein TnpB [Escherichia coli]|uniref:IS66 family insertion sequence element accessory protein TnpA n=1 Tax=Escherichia coli TaxID=562 RepID=UPI00175DCC48|nr:IS66 family insertion sequence element accessory protein TnpB [Escherichia coli]MDB7124702.1 IS66 family insertion sequence element accessory protein TnpB [Escherichia coli]MDD8075434.1 IS66 family insertion sequence element accessory protein TnpB [Escherichia coli]MDD8183538.1 IS66 family insertion sequence element accessory protein TnpB [Escherichia coli]HAI3608752.1 IS66 family insertion sequence element accessory protein TnpB [Escherichia coli]
MAGQWTFPDGVCEQHNIPNKSMRYWPKDIARADRKEQGPAFIPVSVSGLPESRGTTATAAGEPVSLYLPGGIRLCCRAAQLADVFRELRHADT